ncbi:MAG: TusE/DsrC/DsvC family sulfur relay protein [Wenzhouxiangella sp.]|jgi:tRNA 2-thiouridine synthesizing protein E|nr:TusE/DsrC/DsvC family sulfur relay protein [Wenzhouxiangella sp.]
MTPDRDDDGHLVDLKAWTPTLAQRLADEDGFELEQDHWWVIDFVRQYHQQYGNPPLMRTLVAALRAERGAEFGSRELYRLFPEGPVRLACKYGGLPKPDWCI